ncbi:MAG TPA: mismatch-specific DNA-glycosylase [Alphaproteobacteria bacterium]|nr:mismatch-specific DNA-glycosylase [Alphaproteobacteria bacterium]
MKRIAAKPPVLPDLLQPGLAVVFCGTAPGRVSAAAGHYYAHPQNKFWRTLYAVSLTPRLLNPAEYALLPRYGIGLTDIAKFTSGQDNQLPRTSLGVRAIRDLRDRIEQCAPRILAFTSLEGGRRFLGRKAGCGAQKETIGATRIWILPSPSPKAHWNWDEGAWRALAEEVASC